MKQRRKQGDIFRTTLATCAALVVALIGAAGAGAQVRLEPIQPAPDLTRPAPFDNGYHEYRTHTDVGVPTLEPDAGWTSFVWYGEEGRLVFNSEGPFAFSTSTWTTLRITDDFCAGDRFRVYDNGKELQLMGPTVPVTYPETTPVPTAGGFGIGPDKAFRAIDMSSGIYQLKPGDHEITIQVIENPWRLGRAFLRVDTEYPMGAFDLDTVASTYDRVHGQDRFRFVAHLAPSIQSDGMWPESEELTLWYGRYMEVLPAGSLACGWNEAGQHECTYESDGPGIRSVRIVDGMLVITGSRVDLCPGGNPLFVALWIGNDGASPFVRCEGTLRNDAP